MKVESRCKWLPKCGQYPVGFITVQFSDQSQHQSFICEECLIRAHIYLCDLAEVRSYPLYVHYRALIDIAGVTALAGAPEPG